MYEQAHLDSIKLLLDLPRKDAALNTKKRYYKVSLPIINIEFPSIRYIQFENKFQKLLQSSL